MNIYLSGIRYGIIVGILFMLTMISCSDNSSPISDTPAEPVHRTVLVYMIASNNLHSDFDPTEDYDHLDLQEMREAASTGALNGGRLLVYHVTQKTPARLLEIDNNGNETVLCTYPSGTVSVSSEQMTRVLDDVARLAPASDYGLVLWSHGSGWLEDGIETAGSQTLRSFGLDGPTAKMNVSTLANILNGRDLSFIYFDCCYMATIEVMYELKDCAPFIIGSASELPVYGMDYTLNLPCLFSPGKPNLEQAVRNTYNFYNMQSGLWRTCTISLIDTSRLEDLASAARTVFLQTDFPYALCGIPQQYAKGTSYYFDFADYINMLPVSDDEAITDLNNAINEAVVSRYATPYLWPGDIFNQLQIKTHCGLSSYIILSENDIDKKSYRNLRWYTDVVSAMTER